VQRVIGIDVPVSDQTTILVGDREKWFVPIAILSAIDMVDLERHQFQR
jgi:hypothetical protein